MNRSSDRVDRRLRENRRADRRSVIALRERGGRILTDVFVRESEGAAFANARIAPGSNVVTDMIAHWDLLDPSVLNRSGRSLCSLQSWARYPYERR